MPRRLFDDEMLVAHQPAEGKGLSERVTPAEVTHLAPEVDSKDFAARLAVTTDPEERKRLIAQIQERLGNQEAARLIERVRKGEKP